MQATIARESALKYASCVGEVHTTPSPSWTVPVRRVLLVLTRPPPLPHLHPRRCPPWPPVATSALPPSCTAQSPPWCACVCMGEWGGWRHRQVNTRTRRATQAHYSVLGALGQKKQGTCCTQKKRVRWLWRGSRGLQREAARAAGRLHALTFSESALCPRRPPPIAQTRPRQRPSRHPLGLEGERDPG